MEMVYITLYSDDNQQIIAEVPKIHEQEYLKKLENSDFRSNEIRSSVSYNVPISISSNDGLITPFANKGDEPGGQPYTKYFTKYDVFKVIDSIDNSRNWMSYASNPLTDAVVGAAVKVITKSNWLGALTAASIWAAADIVNRSNAWWKDSAIMIVRGQIKGVKVTVKPNPSGSNYPAAIRTYTRY
ncbi:MULTISPECIES: hypothetical protein [Bacillaceae]|uniref:hypothetical protein n=1 Tax=Bacillaceae TaxID=186817 RepID=UPI001CC9D3B1|nr:hypothetical protein [Cytobacillus oceanisediminis]